MSRYLCFVLFACGVLCCQAQPPTTGTRLEAEYYVAAYAQHYGVPIGFVRAIVEQESAWHPCAVSTKGAVGLMQLMPATAARLGVGDRCNVHENVAHVCLRRLSRFQVQRNRVPIVTIINLNRTLMPGTRIRLTREELYKKVWAAPMRTVAQEFGLSASGLANVCRKHNVPVPPVGHWTKIEVGHKITPPALIPELSGNEAVHFYVRERLSPELTALAAEIPPKITIPKELSHALALKTEKLLASGKENERKLLVPKAGTASHLFVSREQLPRALRIMDALFVALEERGHVVSWPKKEDEHLAVSVEGEPVAISLREVIDSVKHVLTPAGQKHPWMAPKWDYKLTGRLRLSIDNQPYSSGPLRGTWADGRIQIVENCLGDFIVGLKVGAVALKRRRLESEEWARRREVERKQREEQQRLAQEHKRKAEFITELINNWAEAERMRAFVKAMTECSAQLDLSEKAMRDIQQVMDWTKEYAESLDPLSDLPDSIDEFVHPEHKYSWLKC